MQTEFIRSLNCNYERILLENKPEERKYQYCILNRGGIRGLLPCSLRYIDGKAYLYYDISSKQSLKQLYDSKSIDRKQILDFFQSLQQLRLELERFLLDCNNILLLPEEIFMELETKSIFYMFVPYFEKDRGCRELMEYLAEHIDYEDEDLVECVYRMYERTEKSGDLYFEAGIFEDVKKLKEIPEVSTKQVEPKQEETREKFQEEIPVSESQISKKSRFSFFEKKKKAKDSREEYRENMKRLMEGRAVAEEAETEYGDTEFGRTLYIEETALKKEYKELCTADGRVVKVIENTTVTIGKRREEADVVLEDPSVSRIHARILVQDDTFFLEDLNSTNGTFKNGLALQPYEKRILEPGDEIRCGRVQLLFR